MVFVPSLRLLLLPCLFDLGLALPLLNNSCIYSCSQRQCKDAKRIRSSGYLKKLYQLTLNCSVNSFARLVKTRRYLDLPRNIERKIPRLNKRSETPNRLVTPSTSRLFCRFFLGKPQRKTSTVSPSWLIQIC